MTVLPDLTLTDLTRTAGRADRPLLLVGPALGTSARHLWAAVATELAETFHVVGWELPGHGGSPPATGFSVRDLGDAVLRAADTALRRRGGGATTFHYAGNSLGGAVGLQLLADAPGRVVSATLLCTGARIGEPTAWSQRAAAVRAGGTAVLLDSAPGRWFGPGFTDREPATVRSLLDDLRGADPASYAALCAALARFDLRARLAEISAPVLAVAGRHDRVTVPASLRHVAHGVQHGRFQLLDDAAHLAPVEQPRHVAAAIVDNAYLGGTPLTTAQVRATGMRIRREVLGDAHVDRAVAGTTALTTDFQQFIAQYAWGGCWARPGLDRRSRSLITLTALVARGHHEELAMHLRAARRNGVTDDEITELLLQTAVYCGVPAANAAFRIAQAALAEPAEPTEPAEADR